MPSPIFPLPILTASPASADSPAASGDPERAATPPPEDQLPYDRHAPPIRIASEGAAHLFPSGTPHLVITAQALHKITADSRKAAVLHAALHAFRVDPKDSFYVVSDNTISYQFSLTEDGLPHWFTATCTFQPQTKQGTTLQLQEQQGGHQGIASDLLRFTVHVGPQATQAAGHKRILSPTQEDLIEQIRKRHEGSALAREPAVETPDAPSAISDDGRVWQHATAVPAASSLLANYESLRLENQAAFGAVYMRLNNLPDFKDMTPEQKGQLAEDALQLFQALDNQTDARGQPAPVAAVPWLLGLCASALDVSSLEALPTLSQLTPAQNVAIHTALKPELARLNVLRERPEAIIPIMHCLTEVNLPQRPGDLLPAPGARTERQYMTIGTLRELIASELTFPELQAAFIAWLETTPNASEASSMTTSVQRDAFNGARIIASKANEHRMAPQVWLESIILPILPKKDFALPTPEKRNACIEAIAQALGLTQKSVHPCLAFIQRLTGAQLKWDNAMLSTTALPDNPLPPTGPWRGLHHRLNANKDNPTSEANRKAFIALYHAKATGARGTTDEKNGAPAKAFTVAMTLKETLENRTDANGQPAPMTMETWLMKLFAKALKVKRENLPALNTLTPTQKQAIFETLKNDSFALKAVPEKRSMNRLFPLIMSMTRVDMWNRE